MVTIFMSFVSKQSVNNYSIKILNICFKMSFYEFSKLEALSELSLCRSPFILL